MPPYLRHARPTMNIVAVSECSVKPIVFLYLHADAASFCVSACWHPDCSSSVRACGFKNQGPELCDDRTLSRKSAAGFGELCAARRGYAFWRFSLSWERYMNCPKWLAISVFVLLGTGTFAQAPEAGNDSQGKASAGSRAGASAGTAKAPRSAKNGQQEKYERPSDPTLYVGSEVCKTCHEDMPAKDFYKHFEGSPHFVTMLDAKNGPQWQGCEACHGPGKDHVDGGGDKTKIFTFRGATAEQISARCLDCHQYGEEHANYARSAHLQNGVSCIDCHDPHHAKEAQFLMKEKQPQLCYGCHQETKQQFARTFRHRVDEGLLNCSDCHNPHGAFQPHQLRTASTEDQVCYKCHADKQGPFVYEHEVVKVEGCVSCHTPHGSSNPRLLKRTQVNLQCLECHSYPAGTGPAAPPAFHNQAQKYQACTLCHVAIHGSNTSSVFFTP